MKKFLFVGMLFALIPFVSLAQVTGTTSGTTTPAPTVTLVVPGLLPTDFFYFLDRWGEAINTFFTFNKEVKARLHLEYANERAAEIKTVLSDPKAKLEDVADARTNFDEQIADAAAVIKEEKDKGIDVSILARDLNNEMDVSRNELKGAFRSHGDLANRAEQQIRAKLEALSPNDPQVAGLTQALESIIKEMNSAVDEGNKLDQDLADEQEIFDEAMGSQMAAEKHMEQALRLREFMMERGAAEGIPGDISISTEQLMKQARDAMMRGDFESAKKMSEQVKSMYEKMQEQDFPDIPEIQTDESASGINDNFN